MSLKHAINYIIHDVIHAIIHDIINHIIPNKIPPKITTHEKSGVLSYIDISNPFAGEFNKVSIVGSKRMK